MEADFLQTPLHFKVPIDKETQSGDLEIPRQVRGRPDHSADCFEMRAVSDERPQQGLRVLASGSVSLTQQITPAATLRQNIPDRRV